MSRLEIPSGFWPFPSLSLYRCFSPGFCSSLSLSFLGTCVYKYRVLAHPQSAVSLSPMQEKTFAEKSTHVPRRFHVCARTRSTFHAQAFDRIRLYCRYHKSTTCLDAPRAFQHLSPSYARNWRVRQRALSMIYHSPVACALLSRMVPATCHFRFDPLYRTMKIATVPASSKNRMRIVRANLRAKFYTGVVNPECADRYN